MSKQNISFFKKSDAYSMRSEFVDITPELAKAAISNLYPKQRPLAPNRIIQFSEQMKRGEWPASPQTISFTSSGQLLDGQHRMHAVIASGMTIRFLCVYGVPEDAFEKIDAGRPRSIKFRSGIDSTQDMAIIGVIIRAARHGRGSMASTTEMVSLTSEFISDALNKFNSETVSTGKVGVTTAPMKAGVILNLIQHPEFNKEIIDAYNSMLGDIREAPRSVISLYQRLSSEKHVRSKSEMVLAVSWKGFSPTHFSDAKILIRDLSGTLTEIRDTVLKDLSGSLI